MPTAQQQVEWAARREQARKELSRRTVAKRELLESLAVDLPELEAAVECPCGCHPTPGNVDAGHAQADCQCQLPPELRQERRRIALDALREAFADSDDPWADQCEDFAGAVARLGVSDGEIRVFAAPMVVSGVVDGRAFYLRERHERWKVCVATAVDPVADVWGSDVDAIDIADGTNWFTPADGLQIAVEQVRLYVRRIACPHESGGDHNEFCGRCGIRQADRDQWVEPSQ